MLDRFGFPRSFEKINSTLYCSFHSVVVITSALHAEGPQFDPGWKQYYLKIHLFLCFEITFSKGVLPEMNIFLACKISIL